MTTQETFDQCVAHLRRQKVPAIEGAKCLYRTTDGKKCAAGYFIPDAEYDPVMEGMSLCFCYGNHSDPDDWGFADNQLGQLACWKEHSVRLMHALQLAHDNAARDAKAGCKPFLLSLEENLANIAKNHVLVYVPPSEAA